MAVLESVVKLLNEYSDFEALPIDWRGACQYSIVPLYKGNGDEYECSNSRDFSLLNVDRALIKKGGDGWDSMCNMRGAIWLYAG